MILHTINKSPFNHTALADCIGIIGDDDGLLLLEDGVYALAPGTAGAALLQQARERGIGIYAIADDIVHRGIDSSPIAEAVDYTKFVALTLEYATVHSWY